MWTRPNQSQPQQRGDNRDWHREEETERERELRHQHEHKNRNKGRAWSASRTRHQKQEQKIGPKDENTEKKQHSCGPLFSGSSLFPICNSSWFLKISANVKSVETWKIMKSNFALRDKWNFKVHRNHKTWKYKKQENALIPGTIKTNLLKTNTPSVIQCNTGNLQTPKKC